MRMFLAWLLTLIGGMMMGISIGFMWNLPVTGNELIKNGFIIVDNEGRMVDQFDDEPFTRSYTTTTP